MKRVFLKHAMPTVLFAGVGLALVFSDQLAVGQVSSIARSASDRLPITSVKRTLVGSERFAAAALANQKLFRELRWKFGGRRQTGWEIYLPLISQTIGTDATQGSPEFAEAVSRWQQNMSLRSTGVIDEETLEAFIKHWQSRRLGRSNDPGSERLLSAPIAEFYDPTRSPELLFLEPETYAAYKQMIAAAAKELGSVVAPRGKFLSIVSAYRSAAYQAELRRRQPNAGRGALAVNSPHTTGQALDLYVGGEPVSTNDANRLLQSKTPAYKWLVRNAHKFGFRSYFYEPWHWEYVGN